MNYCPRCDSLLDDADSVCRRCGAQLGGYSSPQEFPAPPQGYPPPYYDPHYYAPRPHRYPYRPIRVIAVLLAFLLGSIGAHKFYCKHVIQGTLYLLLCWTLIPAIIAFIEGILYMCYTDEQFDSIYWRPI